MIKKISTSILILVLSTSCVSKKIFNELESKFSDLKKQNRHLSDTNDSISKLKNKLDIDYLANKTDLEKTKAERDKLDRKSTRLNSSHITPSRMPSSA